MRLTIDNRTAYPTNELRAYITRILGPQRFSLMHLTVRYETPRFPVGVRGRTWFVSKNGIACDYRWFSGVVKSIWDKEAGRVIAHPPAEEVALVHAVRLQEQRDNRVREAKDRIEYCERRIARSETALKAWKRKLAARIRAAGDDPDAPKGE